MTNALYNLLVKLSLVLTAVAAQNAVYTIKPLQGVLGDPKPVVAEIAPNSMAVANSASVSVLQAYVAAQSVAFGVNPALSACLVENESKWRPQNVGPEKHGSSLGLWQIYDRAHPNITRAEAFSVEWSTNWALKQIVAGNVGIWATWNLYCSSTPVFK